MIGLRLLNFLSFAGLFTLIEGKGVALFLLNPVQQLQGPAPRDIDPDPAEPLAACMDGAPGQSGQEQEGDAHLPRHMDTSFASGPSLP